MDFFILKPIDLSRGNDRAFLDFQLTIARQLRQVGLLRLDVGDVCLFVVTRSRIRSDEELGIEVIEPRERRLGGSPSA